jgi:DNA replication and repair protein RecF
MALSHIRITNIRNLNATEFSPESRLNILAGSNGSGKTSILEAIYLLARGRSFRTQSISKVISKGEASLVSTATITHDEVTARIGIKKTASTTEIRVNTRREKKSSELTNYLHVHIIRPESQTLLERGAATRRSFIDWGAFHVEHDYLMLSKKYNQALKQRNKLLRTKQKKTIPSWSLKLVEYGTILAEKRASYIEGLEKECRVISSALLGDHKLKLVFNRGWSEKYGLKKGLEESLEKDLHRGYTSVGAHRSDVSVYVDDKLAQDYLSRGQMKLLVLSLYLAQVKVTSKKNEVAMSVLIDDLAAELDPKNIKRVVNFLDKAGAQVFITTTNSEIFSQHVLKEGSALFHVKQGNIEKAEQ